MHKLSTFGSAAALCVLIAGSVTSSAYAWHPQGEITKTVQNITTGSAVSDANDAAHAVTANTGDILQYTVTIKNIAPAADKHYNDMAFVGMADSLPTGVELVDTPQVRQVTAKPDTILPGKSFVKTYKVKVTETRHDVAVVNTACFSADSANKDTHLGGCDKAFVKMAKQTTPVTPAHAPTPAPVTPGTGNEAPQTPAELPNTGTGIVAPIAGALAAFGGYTANLLRLKRRKS
jgi:uncharacterized repeat protein (TIGR01451 family)